MTDEMSPQPSASAPSDPAHGGRLSSSLLSLATQAKAVPASLPALRKARIAQMWLIGARRAQILLVVGALMLLLLVPTVARRTLQIVHPPKTQSQFLGLVKKSYSDPRVESGARVVLVLGWALLAGAVALLVCVELPVAAERATKRARRFEEEADSLRSTDPVRSVLLYQAAAKYAASPSYESSVNGKAREVQERIATLSQGGAAGSKGPLPAASALVDDGRASTPLPGLTMADPVDRIGPGGRFQTISELGRGGMGVVYLAKDTVLDRDVALKELPARLAGDEGFAARFRQEARVLAKLSHPNIVQVFDLVDHKGALFMAMELVTGGDLDNMIRKVGRMPPSMVARLMAPVADAMALAHSKGIVHRDFKPMNVLLTGDGVPKVTDFGLAKIAAELGDTMHTQEGAILGSPRYISPEQASGRPADARADVYSFGVTLYLLFTGKLPFEGDTGSLLAQHITQPPPDPRSVSADLPDAVVSLLTGLLEKDPDRRSPDMTGIARALRELAGA